MVSLFPAPLLLKIAYTFFHPPAPRAGLLPLCRWSTALHPSRMSFKPTAALGTPEGEGGGVVWGFTRRLASSSCFCCKHSNPHKS